MKQTFKPRILLCRSGLDEHDRGMRHLAIKLRECGMEVIYLIFLDTDEAINAAIQEDVHVVGLSSFGGGHLSMLEDIIAGIKAKGRDDVMYLAGGIIPNQDKQPLLNMGVAGIFGPGSTGEQVSAFVNGKLANYNPLE